MTTPTPRETMLRWCAMIAMYGSEALALSVLLRKADELDRLKQGVRSRGLRPELLIAD
jgi:hypothetical protein